MMDGFLQTDPTSLPGNASLPATLNDAQRSLETLHLDPDRVATNAQDWRSEYHGSSEFPSRIKDAMARSDVDLTNKVFESVLGVAGLRPDQFSEFRRIALSGPDADPGAAALDDRWRALLERTKPHMAGAVSRPIDADTGTLRTPDGLHGTRTFVNPAYGMRSTIPRYRGGFSAFPIYGPRAAPTVDSGKGKARMVELDDREWEAQFARIDAQGQELDAKAPGHLDAEFKKLHRVILSENSDQSDLEALWKGIHAENGIDASNQGNIDLGLADLDWPAGFDGVGVLDDSFRDPELGEYVLEEDNPFREVPDPFQEGMRIMQEGGNLSLAALAFEAVVWKEPNRAEAWSMLGNAQAQNEKESPAIRALEQALRLDPSDLSALMGLAVSYTNEGYDSSAYRTLERWLAIKYPDVAGPVDDPSNDVDYSFGDRLRLHDRVTEHFIKAAQLSPAGEQMDPDVQVGLGVLFYGAEEYDKAVDCFSAALASTEAGTSNRREQLHLLWNRLGATLANSGRSEEAIAAYEKALTLRPNFVRARYNLGISCINMGVYEAAAQHLLGALAMHRVVEQDGRERARSVVGGGGDIANPVSDRDLDRLIHHSQNQNPSTNLFDTLRRVFVQMGRSDLADKVGPDIDLDSFRAEFDF